MSESDYWIDDVSKKKHEWPPDFAPEVYESLHDFSMFYKLADEIEKEYPCKWNKTINNKKEE